jgi:hypothetical protein
VAEFFMYAVSRGSQPAAARPSRIIQASRISGRSELTAARDRAFSHVLAQADRSAGCVSAESPTTYGGRARVMLQITERRRIGVILAIFVVSALVLIALAVSF